MKTKTLFLWLLLSVTIPSFAYSYKFKSGDLYYNTTSGSTAEVTWDSDGSYRKLTSVIIPQSVTSNGTTYRVTIIGRAAFGRCTGLTSITIPNSVTTIGDNAFYNCTSLTSIIIPNSVTSIGAEAFWGCTGLTSVTIPNSVTTIAYETFYNCTGLTSVTIPDGVTDIGTKAFGGCTSLTSIAIPNSVTIIGNNAFIGTQWYENQPDGILYIGSILHKYKGVPPGTTIIVKNGTTSISSGAFSGCTGLIYVSIPNSVTSIGNDAFYNVANIVYSGAATGAPWGAKSVNGYVEGCLVYSDATKTTLLACSSTATGAITIPNSVTNIGAEAFSGCAGLTSIIIPNSVTTIGNGAFLSCTSLTAVTIPDGVTSIGDWGTFYNCTSLTSVTIGNSVTTIGSEAFYNCTSLTSVTIGNSVTSIGNRAFYNCDNLTSVAIGNSVTTIGSEAFSGEGSFNGRTLTSVTIPNSVTSIGAEAFSGRTGLTSITIPNSVTTIGSDAFRNVFNIIYYGTATGAPWGAENMNGYEEGYLFYSDITKKILLRCNRTATETITIPNSVTTIGTGAFWGCTGLTSVTIPNSVTTIGDYAFYGCDNLTSVTIPNSVTTIGEYAFGYCTDLISIAIPNSVTTIGNKAFYNVFNIAYSGTATGAPWGAKNMNGYEEGYLLFSDATKNTLLRCNRAAKGEIIIPSSVTSIEGAAFECCTGLTSITIPNSVTSIGYNAFHHVANIVYSGTATGSPWGALSVNGYIEGDFVYSDAIKNTLLRCNRTAKGEIIIPNSVTSIGAEAFWGCTGLTSVTIPNSVTTIGDYAFYGCDNLTSVTISNSVTTIGNKAFYNVFNIVYSGTATGAPWGAKNMNGYEEGYLLFSDATKNTLLRCNRAAKGEIIIPSSVTSIEGATFSNCTGLTSVTCYIVEPLSIYENTFSKVNIESIPLYVPQESVAKYQETNIWRDFMEIKAISATPVKETDEPVLEPEENEVTITWPANDNADTYTLTIQKGDVVFCIFTFDANGVLQGMRFAAPSRYIAQHTAQAEATGNGFRFVVEGLDRATTYAYSITATDKAETVLTNYSGTFTTQAPTGTEDILYTPSQSTTRKVFRNGQVYILCEDDMYNINGTKM